MDSYRRHGKGVAGRGWRGRHRQASWDGGQRGGTERCFRSRAVWGAGRDARYRCIAPKSLLNFALSKKPSRPEAPLVARAYFDF